MAKWLIACKTRLHVKKNCQRKEGLVTVKPVSGRHIVLSGLYWTMQAWIFFSHIHVVVQFYPWFKFSFPLFLGIVMYDNEFETKEKKIWTKDKIEPQHTHVFWNNHLLSWYLFKWTWTSNLNPFQFNPFSVYKTCFSCMGTTFRNLSRIYLKFYF